jgi:hypothetical protein
MVAAVMTERTEDLLQPGTENETNDVKSSLISKYRDIFIAKLSPEDLRELQFYLKNRFRENRTLDADYTVKFEEKLRQYFHEEILKREIVSIETLLTLLRPEDLKK